MEQNYIYKDKIIELCKDISKISTWKLEFTEGIKVGNMVEELSDSTVIQQYYSLCFTNEITKDIQVLNENFEILYKDREFRFSEYYYRILQLIIKHGMEVPYIIASYYVHFGINVPLKIKRK